MLIHIVDDNDTNLMLFRQIALKLAEDIEVLCFADPIKALAECQVRAPDMVVLDYMMPGMDGHQYLAETRKLPPMRDVPVIMVTAADDRSVRHKALELGATDFLTKPIDVHEVRVRLQNLLALRRNTLTLKDRNRWLADEVRKATSMINEREHELIVRLSRAAEFRDPETGAHIQRMAYYSLIIAKGLNLPVSFQDLLLRAAPMHDVGKLGIPDGILLKPARLDEHEIVVMKRHPAIGHAILADSPSQLIRLGAEIALSHHEKMDGTGYPNGLIGEDIPISGRIVAVADVFDALTSERPYKKAWSVDEARNWLLEKKNSHFDASCVDALLAAWNEVQDVRARFADAPPAPADADLL